MAVHIEPYNILRVRRARGEDETWFYLERHRKTILNKDGKKQWRLMVKMVGRATNFHIWLNI